MLWRFLIISVFLVGNWTTTHAQPLPVCPMDMMLVLDGSGSIATSDFELMREFASRIVENVPMGEARVGIVQFSTGAALEIAMSDESRAIYSAIEGMQQQGGDTDIVAGMLLAQEELPQPRAEIPQIMVVLTDGEHTEGGDPVGLATEMRREGIELYGLAVGEANLDQISAIAGGDQNLFLAENFAGLLPILNNLLDRSCNITADFRASHLAFTSDRDGDLEVYLLDPNTNVVTQLTFNEATDNVPTFSPDGRKIVFESDMDGDYDLWVMDTDGSNLTNLTNNDWDDFGPSWSPDGALIAYHATPGNATNIFVINADGTNPRPVTNFTEGITRSASWSPDGQRVVYQSDASGGRELYITNVFTGGTTRLTFNEWYDGLPDWSPTGSQIVFGSTQEDGDVEIWVMRADGSNPRRLTYRPGVDDDPAWSPDGTRIIFESDTTGDNEVWIIDADGTDLLNITNDPAFDYSSDWGWKAVRG